MRESGAAPVPVAMVRSEVVRAVEVAFPDRSPAIVAHVESAYSELRRLKLLVLAEGVRHGRAGRCGCACCEEARRIVGAALAGVEPLVLDATE